MPKVGVDNIIINNGKILLIQRSAESKNFPLHWGFIGGWMEEGELPIEALIREAKEEIGVEITDYKFIGKIFSNIMPNGVTRIVLPYIVKVASENFVLQKEEIADAKWYTFTEALELNWAYDHKDIFLYYLSSESDNNSK